MDPLFLDRLADQPEEELKVSVSCGKVASFIHELTLLFQRKTINKKLNKVKTGQNKAGQQAINHKCADKDGVWRGGFGGVVSNQTELQEAGEFGGLRDRNEDDEEADAPEPAPKRRRHC